MSAGQIVMPQQQKLRTFIPGMETPPDAHVLAERLRVVHEAERQIVANAIRDRAVIDERDMLDALGLNDA